MPEILIEEIVITHLGMDDHPTWALCTGEVFSMPPFDKTKAVQYCPDCYKIAFMKFNTKENNNG